MVVSTEQKRKFNLFYEQKFKKFYCKFQLRTGNVKESLLENLTHLEYAYSLSQSEGVPESTQAQWKLIWSELTAKTSDIKSVDAYHTTLRFTVSQTIHLKRFKSFEKYILFFIEEYNRISSK